MKKYLVKVDESLKNSKFKPNENLNLLQINWISKSLLQKDWNLDHDKFLKQEFHRILSKDVSDMERECK